METPPTTQQPQYVPPVQPLPPQPTYVQPQLTQPITSVQQPTLDQRLTEDIVTISDHITSWAQAIVIIVVVICLLLAYLARSKGKEMLKTLKEIKNAKALNGPFDELVDDVKAIKEETVKNSKQNEIDHKRWMAYCSNPKNMNKKECIIHPVD